MALSDAISRYKAHNDALARRHGVAAPDEVARHLRDAQYYLERSRRTTSDRHKIGCLHEAVDALLAAVVRARGGGDPSPGGEGAPR